MNLEEYKNHGYRLYADFAEAVKNILCLEIEKKEIKFQQVKDRAKSIFSLEKKLKIFKVHENKIEKVYDLAACRVIFYFNDDIKNFISSNILCNNFDVDHNRSKTHYPSDSNNHNPYTANHYIIKLRENRYNLPEYSQFKGLLCEIQLQTVLSHAWSETNHDIIYKKPNLERVGKNKLDSIEKRLREIDEKYIKPAGHEFTKIKRDYDLIISGDDIAINIIDILRNSNSNNNDRYEILQRFKDVTISVGYDDAERAVNSIIFIVEEAIRTSKNCKNITAITTPFGEIKGKTEEDILLICFDILSYIKYVKTDYILKFSLGYSINKSQEIAKKSQELLKNISEYNINALKQIGVRQQKVIIQELENLSDDDLKKYRQGIAIIGKEILSSETESTSYDGESMTWSKGMIPANEEVKTLRRKAILILEKIYKLCGELADKIQILSSLEESERLPYNQDYGDDLLLLSLEDSKEITEFYIGLIADNEYLILQKIEGYLCFRWHFCKSIKENYQDKNSQILKACDELEKLITQFRGKLDQNERFTHFKTLIGYDSILPGDWDDWGSHITKGHEYKSSLVKNYANSINQNNWQYWQDLILDCVKLNPKGGAEYHLREFLGLIGKNHLDFAIKLIAENEKELSPFLYDLLFHIYGSDHKNQAKELISGWTKSGKYLSNCALIIIENDDVADDLMEEIFSKAVKIKDEEALTDIIHWLYRKNSELKNQQIVKEFFILAIRQLSKSKNIAWTGYVYTREGDVILKNLSEEDADIILGNLLHSNKIDYHVESILGAVVKQHPEKVINFFGERIKIEKNDREYDAIPYDFHEKQLLECLSQNAQLIVKMVRGWFDENKGLFRFSGGKFLKEIFPKFPKDFEEELLKLIHSKNEDDFSFVVAVLINYKGEVFLHNICKEMVKLLPTEGKELRVDIGMILNSSGGVWGEFGMRDLYKQKKEETMDWLSDVNEKVRDFTKDYHVELDQYISRETKRVEEEIELRRHKYKNNNTQNQEN